MSLLGLPLTVGFGGRWAIIIASGQALHLSWLPYFLLLAMIIGISGLLRSLINIISQLDDESDSFTSEEFWLKDLSAFILLIGGYLAIFPQVLNSYAYLLADLLR
jgi:NADH:ubiquinone oxidoreductase subunit 2 (subunit N)